MLNSKYLNEKQFLLTIINSDILENHKIDSSQEGT